MGISTQRGSISRKMLPIEPLNDLCAKILLAQEEFNSYIPK